MGSIEQELSQSRQVRSQVESARERHEYAASEKNNALIAYFDIILEHHDAIGVLVEKELIGSSFALVRPVVETLFRALWVNACASPAQIAQVLRNDEFKFPKDMIEKIDIAYATQDFFQNLKRSTWSSMCSYAHSGQLQITRRLNSDGCSGPKYSEAEVIEVLRHTTSVVLTFAILFFKSVEKESEASEMEKLAFDYCAP